MSGPVCIACDRCGRALGHDGTARSFGPGTSIKDERKIASFADQHEALSAAITAGWEIYSAGCPEEEIPFYDCVKCHDCQNDPGWLFRKRRLEMDEAKSLARRTVHAFYGSGIRKPKWLCLYCELSKDDPIHVFENDRSSAD